MKSRLLLFTDPHITPKAAFSHPTSDGYSTYLQRVIQSFMWIENLVLEHAPDFVICLGDVTETTGFVDTTSLKVTSTAFDRLSQVAYESGGCVICLVGNHDAYSVEHNIHNLEFLKHMQNVWVIDKPTPLVGAPNIFCIPWCSDPESIEIPDKTDCILAHLDIEGSFLYKTKKADFGAKPGMFRAPVFNGHVHNPGPVGTNVHNLGALLSRNFSDTDSEPRGAYLVEVDKHVSIESFFPNPHDIGFRDVFIRDEIEALHWQEKLESGESGLENSYVRIRYSAEFEEVAQQLTYLTQGSKTQALPSKTTTSSSPKFSAEHFSAEQAFEKYVDSQNLGLVSVDVLARGIELLREAAKDIEYHTLPITFEKLEANNFQSLGHVTIRLDVGDLWYVEGRNEDDPYDANGVGKSTIHEAIYWCLTGKSLRKYTGDEVIHWARDYCNVKLWFAIGEQQYWLFRSRKDPDDGTTVSLWKRDGDDLVDISARLKSDTDKMVADLIGRSTKVLQHSVFLTSDLAQKFTSLSYPDRIRLVEDITDVGVFAKAGKLAEKELDGILREVSEARGALKSATTSKQSTEQKIEEIKSHIYEVKLSLEPTLKELKQKLADNQTTTRETEVSLENSELELAPLLPKVSALENKVKAIGQQYLSTAEENRSITTALGIVSNQVNEIRSLIARGNCPECGQRIEEKAPVCGVLEEKEKELEELESRSGPVATKYERLATRRGQLDEALEQLHEEVEGHTGTISSLKSRLQAAQLEDLRLKQELDNCRNETASLESARDALIRSLGDLDTQISEHTATLESHEYMTDVLTCLVDAFHTTGIRADLLFQVSLPFLNSRLSEYSTQLGQPCCLDYKETKSGHLEEKVEVSLPGSRSYKGLSRGEKRMVDLSIQLAINDLAIATGGSHVNLLICDEVIDSIDETTLSAFVKILKSKSEGMTIFLMAHRPFLAEKLGNTMTLIKRDGVTHVEGEL